MTNPFDSDGSISPGDGVAPQSMLLKASIMSAIVAEPGLELSEVRISVSSGYVVMEGYVSDRDHIDKVFAIAEAMAGKGRVKCFVFHPA